MIAGCDDRSYTFRHELPDIEGERSGIPAAANEPAAKLGKPAGGSVAARSFTSH
jgi:hypothetical protein